jgi:RNA polymerase sigma-54 factor
MRLSIRQNLRQILTPHLLQYVGLLQLPKVELEQALRQEIRANPLLEEVEDADDSDQEPSEEEITWERESSPADSRDSDADWERYLEHVQEGPHGTYEPLSAASEVETDVYERTPVVVSTLEDHLLQQLNLLDLGAEQREIGAYLVCNLDDRGYLVFPLEELAPELGCPLEKLEEVLLIIQSLDPSGVGATSISECLLIQMRHRGVEDGLAARIVRQHFLDLEKKNYAKIARALRVTEHDVREAEHLIASLDPKPGLAYSSAEIRYVIPDFVVERVDGELLVLLNEGNVPHLRVRRDYREIMRQTRSSPEDRDFVKRKLEIARSMIKALHKRRSTMLKIMNVILSVQRDFFERGPSCLKPLTLRAVADDVGVSESTVSRAVQGKYVLTPRGLFALSYFFGGSLETDNGDNATKEAVKGYIRDIILQENTLKPLSDQEIAKALRQTHNVRIARRTVAKYREELDILAAKQRAREAYSRP